MPYFLAGSGHIMSARAIAFYIARKKPNWDIRFIEPADEFNAKELDEFFRRSWNVALTKPRFAAVCFTLLDKLLPFIPIAINTYIIRKYLVQTYEYLQAYRPDLIITTHWGCGHLFQSTRLHYGLSVPLFLVRNDLGGAFQIQDCGSDLTFVMSEEAVEAFVRIGVPRMHLRRVNLLVRPEFAGLPPANGKKTRKKLGIPKEAIVVLLSAGGEGLGAMEEYARVVLEEADSAGAEVRLMFVTGRNQELYERMQRELVDPRVLLFGYRDDMPDLMAAADIVAGKCGANYTMETLMMRKPFIITQVGAPNEEFNKDYVVTRGMGWHAPDPNAFRPIFRRILTDPTVLAATVERLNTLPETSGAEEIADAIIQALNG